MPFILSSALKEELREIKSLIQLEKLLKGKSLFAVETIDSSEVHKYGIISGKEVAKNFWKVNSLVEKPKPEDAPSNLGVIGRYIFNPDIFNHLHNTKPGFGGEIQLTDAMHKMAEDGEIYAWIFEGKRYDIGNMEDWFR